MTPLPGSVAELRAGGKPALARCLTALEIAAEDPALAALLDAAYGREGGLVLGLTGPPGVGKSTLTSALVARHRAAGETVGVIAVDPSSRRSGGALLGDRARIATDPGDAGVFVRSMAARSRLGGIADLTYPAALLMRAVFDRVIVETVGVGQSESAIADCADLVIFCAQPGSGDALQYMKAGIFELPDIVLVTKGDLGAAAIRTAADARGALSLAAEEGAVEVAIVSAETGEGMDAACALIAVKATAAPGLLAHRRRGQGRAWAESRLVDSFGSEGLRLLASRLAPEGAPFARLAEALRAARTLVHAGLENL